MQKTQNDFALHSVRMESYKNWVRFHHFLSFSYKLYGNIKRVCSPLHTKITDRPNIIKGQSLQIESRIFLGFKLKYHYLCNSAAMFFK